MTDVTTKRVAYSPAEVAAMTGQSQYLIRRMLAEGKLRYTRAGRNILIPRVALDEWLECPAPPTTGRHGVPANK